MKIILAYIDYFFRKASKQAKQRLAICKTCDSNKCGVCKECGCIVRVKVRCGICECDLVKW